VAVIGSVFNSILIGALRNGTVFSQLPEVARRRTEDSVGAARIVAEHLPAARPRSQVELAPERPAHVGPVFKDRQGVAGDPR